MLIEKLCKKINKSLKRMKHNILGPSGKEMIRLARKNRIFLKEQNKKRNESLNKILKEMSKLKIHHSASSKNNSSHTNDYRRNDVSRSVERDDSGSQAYQTGQIF